MKYKDVYEMALIAPILRSETLKQVRSRARAARVKFERHERISRISVGDAVSIYDRITAAEQEAIERIEEDREMIASLLKTPSKVLVKRL